MRESLIDMEKKGGILRLAHHVGRLDCRIDSLDECVLSIPTPARIRAAEWVRAARGGGGGGMRRGRRGGMRRSGLLVFAACCWELEACSASSTLHVLSSPRSEVHAPALLRAREVAVRPVPQHPRVASWQYELLVR